MKIYGIDPIDLGNKLDSIQEPDFVKKIDEISLEIISKKNNTTEAILCSGRLEIGGKIDSEGKGEADVRVVIEFV